MWSRAPSPSTPDNLRLYAVGDVHGRLDLLGRLLEQIERDAATAGKNVLRIFLGDYVDRGPDSSGVIEYLLTLKRQAPDSIFLRGNHEQMMLEFLEKPACYPRWRGLGAEDTLLSYNVSPPIFEDLGAYQETRQELLNVLPVAHRTFLGETRISYASGDYLFVHAGIRPGVFLADQKVQDLLWIRDEFLSSKLSFEKFVVHGHSPTGKPEVRSNRIGIDTRAFKTGVLTALCLDGTGRRFLNTTR
jgi:serine/threonine protein phosphatase 1